MADDFYEPLPTAVSYPWALLTKLHSDLLSSPDTVIIAIFVTIFVIGLTTRLFSGSESEADRVAGKDGRTVWLLPYWFPYVGHGYQFLTNPMKLMREARDQSTHGIFALNLGGTRHNIISDPGLVKGVMQKKESEVQFHPISWWIVERFFGIPKRAKSKYDSNWDGLMQPLHNLMREPHLSNMLKGTILGLKTNIPQMISFARSEIDQQPWERFAKAAYISNSETEIGLMALMRDMLGNASVPGLFGSALMEKHPELLHDVYDMDEGLLFFLMGLPAYTPWPGVMKAHAARFRLWQALDDFQMALDATVDDKPVDASWGDLDDVSELILTRHSTFKNQGFEVEERGDLSILWALTVNANLVVFWQLLYILATPGLLERVRAELAPFVKISRPESIGKISEAPKLTIDYEGLSKNCHLFKSIYFEALRLNSQPWSVRSLGSDVIIPSDKKSSNSVPYIMHKGEYITVPHDLHMLDPKYFKNPTTFDPERFLVQKEDGSLATDQGTIRPYGAGPSMCKGRIFAEKECLALVAGVLMFWDIEPADTKAGWVIPGQKKTTAVSLPVKEVRVRIRRRRFEWEE
ncbi:Cytochrome P450 monooxygenase [Hyphodiscus hymeniophilus]|uniref:Cytochrome P450 monooxygenase n=1 Tax=Hyphodiscus hymeniophilus TaxID=353542 RepID=A0A9P7AWX3_9HELO|nr:Cytochrome P450 monooxygenase [Hyphodiscus hymeniophilus]